MESQKKKFWCGDCEKGWVKKTAYEEHFDLEKVREGEGCGGKLIPNICFNKKRKSSFKTHAQVIQCKKSKTLFEFSCSKSVVSDSSEASTSEVQDEEKPHDDDDQVTENITENVQMLETETISHESVSSINQTSTKNICDSIDVLSKKIDHMSDSINNMPESLRFLFKDSLKEMSCTPSGSAKDTQHDFEKYLQEIKQAESMKAITDNSLVKNTFSVFQNEEDETEYMKCNICAKWDNPNSAKNLGIALIEGSNYSIYQSGIKKPMSRAFSNFKKTLVVHIESQSHNASVKQEKEFNYQNKNAKESVAHAMRQQAYFTIKCNLPFNQFENLCATEVFSGLDLGNINHTRFFIDKFLDVINKELVKKTVTWFHSQTSVTVTLDVGTECGIPLLAVLFLSDNKSKLADIIPITSKKGVDLASTCFAACTMNDSLDKKELEAKIVGVTGDGAFSKGNSPFKNKMEELFNKKLVFRWDLLHLVNRAHLEAKGKVEGEDDETFVLDDASDDETIESEDKDKDSMICELINYIQKSARKLRTGLSYSQLKNVTAGQFKRPKVWSTTRMVVYEFEMIERFLENSVFLDIPIKFLLLAKCQCLVMFCLKIILKNVQRIDITSDYVNKVIVNQLGKEAMKLANQVAVDLVLNKSTDYIDEKPLSEQTDICFLSENTFCKELRQYITKKEFFSAMEVPHERNTRSEVFSIEDAKEASNKYIEDLWRFIQKRVVCTDLSESASAYTEAPAEGIFSIYGRVITGRESLSIDHAVALTRVSIHGPPPATQDSASFVKEAMKNYQSKFGERYCTLYWKPGVTSSTVKKVESKQWDW